jgi:hypothetical protein
MKKKRRNHIEKDEKQKRGDKAMMKGSENVGMSGNLIATETLCSNKRIK